MVIDSLYVISFSLDCGVFVTVGGRRLSVKIVCVCVCVCFVLYVFTM